MHWKDDDDEFRKMHCRGVCLVSGHSDNLCWQNLSNTSTPLVQDCTYTYQGEYAIYCTNTLESVNKYSWMFCLCLCLKFSCWQNLLANVFFYVKNFANRWHLATLAQLSFCVLWDIFCWIENLTEPFHKKETINMNIFLMVGTSISIYSLSVRVELCHHFPFIHSV